MRNNKSLIELGEWRWEKEPSQAEISTDKLTLELNKISKKKLRDFTGFDLYLAVSQCKGLPYTLPMAVKHLTDDLLMECKFYPGDLLKAALQIPSTYFQQHSEDFIKVAGLVASKDNKRIMSVYDGNRELRRLFDAWTDYKKTYWFRIITKDYRQPIDVVKEFIYHTIEDDPSSDVEFTEYTRYWKTDSQGELSAIVNTVIPFDILRKRIADQWSAADKIGFSFIVDSRTTHINCDFIYWLSIDKDE